MPMEDQTHKKGRVADQMASQQKVPLGQKSIPDSRSISDTDPKYKGPVESSLLDSKISRVIWKDDPRHITEALAY